MSSWGRRSSSSSSTAASSLSAALLPNGDAAAAAIDQSSTHLTPAADASVLRTSRPPSPCPDAQPRTPLPFLPHAINTVTASKLAIKLLPTANNASSSSSPSSSSPSSSVTPTAETSRSVSAAISSATAAVSTTTSVLVSDERIEVDPYDALTAALVPDAHLSLSYSVHASRFYILLLFFAISSLQGLVYCTFSTIPEFFNSYFLQPPRDQQLLDLLLQWAPIVYLPTVFLAAYFFQTLYDGLRRSVLLAAALVWLGTALRMLPSVFSTDYRHEHNAWMIWLVHAGQIVNALAAPLVMASPSKLSVTWFADEERSLATAVATISNGFGIALAYLVFPLLVTSDSQLPFLLRLTCVLAFGPFVLALLYFPDHPASFPSSAAAQRHFNPSLSSLTPQSISFSSGIWRTLWNPSFVLLILSTGINTGVYAVWSATLPSTLAETSFSLQQAASFVSVTRFAGIVGGVMAGWVAGLPAFARRYKPLLCVFLYFCLISFCLFTLTQPSIAVSSPVLPSNWYLLSVLAVGSGGFFLGATIPLSYELGAELTYPAEETTSAAFITLVMQTSSLVMLSVSPSIAQTVSSPTRATPVLTINSVMTITVAVSLLLLCCVREKYRRLEAGRAYAHRNEGVAAVLSYYSQLEESISPSGIRGTAGKDGRASSVGDNTASGSRTEKGWQNGHSDEHKAARSSSRKAGKTKPRH